MCKHIIGVAMKLNLTRTECPQEAKREILEGNRGPGRPAKILSAMKKNENRYLAISTELDYTSEEDEATVSNHADQATGSDHAELNSSIENELDNFFEGMPALSSLPSTSAQTEPSTSAQTEPEITSAQTAPLNTVVPSKKRGRKAGSKNKNGTKKSRALTQLNLN
jgi:hypothetical protein